MHPLVEVAISGQGVNVGENADYLEPHLKKRSLDP